MLLNLRQYDVAEKRLKLLPFFFAYIIYLVSYLFLSLNKIQTNLITNDVYNSFSKNEEISLVIYELKENPMVFVLITLLLFLAILAPIAIASKRVLSQRKQDIYYALSRDLRTVVVTKNTFKFISFGFLELTNSALPILICILPIIYCYLYFKGNTNVSEKLSN